LHTIVDLLVLAAISQRSFEHGAKKLFVDGIEIDLEPFFLLVQVVKRKDSAPPFQKVRLRKRDA
jgi:hypothetical protein